MPLVLLWHRLTDIEKGELIIVLLTVMAFGRVRTGIRLRTDRHLSVPRSGRFLNMVRPGRVGPTSVKYPRNPGQIQESLKTDRVFITSNMDVTGRVLNFKCNG